ncbi:unnamed protein product, partial [Mesorhabditis belari]|uniref:Uncharacterized protein n=1 Tax=Mesorhabditis belari TaxID=2138241 RepID=A0AAF3F2J6_9BILA
MICARLFPICNSMEVSGFFSKQFNLPQMILIKLVVGLVTLNYVLASVNLIILHIDYRRLVIKTMRSAKTLAIKRYFLLISTCQIVLIICFVGIPWTLMISIEFLTFLQTNFLEMASCFSWAKVLLPFRRVPSSSRYASNGK